jgi:hypothetical protein
MISLRNSQLEMQLRLHWPKLTGRRKCKPQTKRALKNAVGGEENQPAQHLCKKEHALKGLLKSGGD